MLPPPMELIKILNRCHHFRGFVYQHPRFSPDRKSIEVAVRPRKGSAAICSRCHQTAPGYDQLAERRFEFIPKAVDEVRAEEARRKRREGRAPVPKKSR